MRRIPARDLQLTVGATVELSDDRAHYLRDVLRLEPGTLLELFDGTGIAFVAEIRALAPLTLEILSSRDASESESPCALTLFQAIPKGDRFQLVLEKATELGIARIVPLQTARTVVRIPPKKWEARRDRWTRIVESAARQCERAVVPEVSLPASLDVALQSALLDTEWFLDARGGTPAQAAIGSGETAAIWIGPEGGFTKAEKDRLAKRAQRVTLGPRILRSETAAITAIAAFQLLTGGLE